MDFKTAQDAFHEIDKTTLAGPKRALYLASVRYARIRSEWFLLSREERAEKNQGRRLAHNALIDACNILSREMDRNDEDGSWRRDLGEERQEIGDFACYLSCFLGLRAR